jgi:carbon monoxide dehydrogenase subunit G
MKVAGHHHLQAPPVDVYAAICDPASLLAVIPGCDAVERVADDEYEGRITLRLPGAVGRYRTHVRLVDPQPPVHAGLEGRVEGAMGSIRGTAAFELVARDGGTDLDYTGAGMIDGPLARLDARFAERLAESLISQGIRALDDRLAARHAMEEPA